MRKQLTPQEVKLWVRLRELRPLGYHPRRQVPLGDVVVDFAFRKERLVVEVDGGQHGGMDDRQRDAALGALGWEVMRFWNSDVDGNLNGVLETILGRLEVKSQSAA